MRRLLRLSRLAAFPIAGIAVTAVAQQDVRNSIRGSSFRDLPVCQMGASASRARPCEPEAATPTASEEGLDASISPAGPPAECRAAIATEYLQSGERVRVRGSIEVDECPAATGEYTVSARVAHESGLLETLEFDERWQTNNDEPVAFEAAYPIGADVEVVYLRVRGIRCACSDVAGE